MVELKQTSDQFEADETENVLQVSSPVSRCVCVFFSCLYRLCVCVFQVNEFSLPLADEEEAEDEDWDLSVS